MRKQCPVIRERGFLHVMHGLVRPERSSYSQILARRDLVGYVRIELDM